MLHFSLVIYFITVEKIYVRDTLLVDYKHIIDTDCIFVETFEPCVTELFRTLHNNDIL